MEKPVILVADDDPLNLQALFDYLRGSGFRVMIAESGEEALEQVKLSLPDIILMDVRMPGLDGFETCRRLKENESTSDIPVIFITALSDTPDKIRGFEMHAVDYITKPFHQEEVLARIKTHLTIQRQKKELAELNEELARANATKDKFFSIIAHDLKGAFNVLISGGRLLSEHIDLFDKDKIKAFAEEMVISAQNTFKLLQNLLQWAGVQRNTIAFKPMKIDLHNLVSANVVFFQKNAEQKKIRVSHSVEPGTNVQADLNMTDTILRNLISNALKFTPANGEVSISAENEGELVRVSVSDTGIGMSDENMSKLFRIEGYFKSVGTAGEKGTGLGLILCKEFAEKNGGTLWVESEEGNGTTFTFSLPNGRMKDDG
ncbi:hybrid sensor histidine kinase/response regulator [Desulfobacterales bacterium HSG2]|nr:hybrid sensor histidine kinase/response regulator [Desulfobacterales bacterium HSG2]